MEVDGEGQDIPHREFQGETFTLISFWGGPQ